MATPGTISELRKRIEGIKGFEKEELISRPKWGEINFEQARPDFQRIFFVVDYLQALPIELLPDNVVGTITDHCSNIINLLTRINQFSLQTGNPGGHRDGLSAELRNFADQLLTASAQWIPFLSYQNGDVARNIQNLTASVQQAQKLSEEAKTTIEQRGKEIEQIIIKAREASAKAGAAVFTQDFSKAAENQDEEAGRWLKYTISAAAITLLTGIGMWMYPEPHLDPSQIVQKISTKLVILALLLTASVWCGRNYKALKHLATINRHRALSIQTLQAFSAAAADTQTKDAVL